MKFELLEKSKKFQQEILRTLELHQGMTIEEIIKYYSKTNFKRHNPIRKLGYLDYKKVLVLDN